PAPAGSSPETGPTAPALPAPPAGAVSAGGHPSAPASPPAPPFGTPSWQQAFWLEALLLLTDPGAAPGEELAWLPLLPALPPGESALALDLLLAGLTSGNTG